MQKIINIVGLSVLSLVIGITVYITFLAAPPEARKTEPLTAYIPAELDGWEVEDKPLGQTEALENRSQELLQTDEYIYREYSQGDMSFEVYIAYWEPEKMPIRLVNTHKPDRCWTYAGWECQDVLSGVEYKVGGYELKPAEYRMFTVNASKQEVLFWHLVGERVHSYGGFRPNPPVTYMFSELFYYGLRPPAEQYFVRVNSSNDFESLWEKPGFRQVMEQLANKLLKQQESENS